MFIKQSVSILEKLDFCEICKKKLSDCICDKNKDQDKYQKQLSRDIKNVYKDRSSSH